MYFETGQGSALSANAHWNCDQQTLEARAYGVARMFDPLLVNTVVGFIGPEYLFDGKQITRAALEDHFCGKLLGLPMGCDVCYTNHAEADQNDMDDLLTLLAVAGVNYVMGVPGADDVMLNYQSTSYHDVLAVRRMLNLAPAPEFAQWLADVGLTNARGELQAAGASCILCAASRKSLRMADDRPTPLDKMSMLRSATPARIFLPRAGSALTTRATLDFQLAHAEARDAVEERLDADRLFDELTSRGLTVVRVKSAARDRRSFLLRPDLGRKLDEASREHLKPLASDYDLAFVIAEGLSARAIARHALPVLEERWNLSIEHRGKSRRSFSPNRGAWPSATILAKRLGQGLWRFSSANDRAFPRPTAWASISHLRRASAAQTPNGTASQISARRAFPMPTPRASWFIFAMRRADAS